MIAFKVCLLAVGALALASVPAQAKDIVGPARVVDGDTVEIGGERIRLAGVDAPETDQLCLHGDASRWACGVEARDRLAERTNGKSWTCHVQGRDRYKRSLATCEVGHEDINGWLVRAGWALSFTRYSHRYNAVERQARADKAGIWSGAFYAPWEARRPTAKAVILGGDSIPRDAQAILRQSLLGGEPPDPRCTVKGNLRSKSGCVYHVRGGFSYAKTKMRGPGRRWFCSAEEAEAAGCSAAKR